MKFRRLVMRTDDLRKSWSRAFFNRDTGEIERTLETQTVTHTAGTGSTALEHLFRIFRQAIL